MVRFALLLSLVAACSEQYGALLVAKGDVKFDQVDVYFGDEAGTKTPTTPGRSVVATDETQRLYHRTYAMEDDWGPKAARTSWSYFLPSLGTNLDLGDYVLILASKEGSPVAIGELFDFEVPVEEAIYRYEIPLVAIDHDAVETWGRPKLDCVRWTHPRGPGSPQTIAVVRDDDADCDSFVDDTSTSQDCESLRYCDGTGTGDCIGRSACVATLEGACVSGACTNRDGVMTACTPAHCLETELCLRDCEVGDAQQLVDCAIDMSAHNATDYALPLMQGDVLCQDPFTVELSLPLPCVAPAVESQGNTITAPEFSFDIMPHPSTATSCNLLISAPSPGAQFEGMPHVLISVNAPTSSGFARIKFVVGMAPRQSCLVQARFEPMLRLDGCGVP